jgi:hypothetical protein
VVLATRGPYRRRSGGSSKKKVGVRHYNLSMPEGLHEAVNRLSDERGTTFKEALCQLVALGLTIDVIMRDPSMTLLMRDRNGEETRILWGWNAYVPSDQSTFSQTGGKV